MDYSFDAVGYAGTTRQCLEVIDYRGTAVLIGFPSAKEVLTIPMQGFFFPGGTLKVSLNGDSLASRDFPQLIDWYLDGNLDLDGLVTEKIGLDDVRRGVHRHESGRDHSQRDLLPRLTTQTARVGAAAGRLRTGCWKSPCQGFAGWPPNSKTRWSTNQRTRKLGFSAPPRRLQATGSSRR